MANLMNKYLILIAVVVLSTSLASCAEGPFIVAHKKASLNRLKSGAERVSVSIDIYNQGSAYVNSSSIYPLYHRLYMCRFVCILL